MRDDGYDISDFYRINPDYGTVADFERFIKAAHERKIRVIADIALNHTSDKHPWFQSARKPAVPSGTGTSGPRTTRSTRTRGLSSRTPRSPDWTWDPVARAYYFSHQPP